jgi:putative sigma-54 modulation protein
MNISLTGRGVDLTEAIKTHMTASIETLNKFHMDIISVNVVATTQTKKGKDHSCIEFVINLAHKNSIIIKQSDDDLYVAIDLATARAQKAMRRTHDRDTSHYKVGVNDEKAQSVDVKEATISMEDEIIPFVLDIYKPREVEDVLSDLKESDKVFEIFMDHEGKTRVLFKRKNSTFGLY